MTSRCIKCLEIVTRSYYSNGRPAIVGSHTYAVKVRRVYGRRAVYESVVFEPTVASLATLWPVGAAEYCADWSLDLYECE